MRGRIFLAAAGLSGAISVATDAIARHMLAGDFYRFELATTSARYGLVHAAVLVGVAVLWRRDEGGFWLGLSGWLFVVALMLFCGSLDVMAFGARAGAAAVTPWGGGAFIAGWVALLVAALVSRS